MGQHGILPPPLRVELIDGEIIEMAPIGPPRAGVPRCRIVDIKDRSVVEFTRPSQAGYLAQRPLRPGDRLARGDTGAPLDGLTIEVADIIG